MNTSFPRSGPLRRDTTRRSAGSTTRSPSRSSTACRPAWERPRRGPVSTSTPAHSASWPHTIPARSSSLWRSPRGPSRSGRPRGSRARQSLTRPVRKRRGRPPRRCCRVSCSPRRPLCSTPGWPTRVGVSIARSRSEMACSSRRGDSSCRSVRGDAGRFAVGWDGVVRPASSVGAAADLEADARAMAAALCKGRNETAAAGTNRSGTAGGFVQSVWSYGRSRFPGAVGSGEAIPSRSPLTITGPSRSNPRR